MRLKLNRTLCVVLCAVMTVLTVFCVPLFEPLEVSAANYSGMSLAELQEQQKQVEKEIAQLKADKASQDKLKKALEKKISNLQSQISACNTQVETLDAQIADNERNISDKRQELESLKYYFRQRLRTIAMNGGESTTSILVLLSADGLEDLLTKSELTKAVSAYDNALSEKILSEMKAIEKAKTDIIALQSEQNEAKKLLADKKKQLDADMKEIKATIGDINDKLDDREDELDALEKAEKELDDVVNETAGNNNQKYDGVFGWPLPSYYSVTSPYGYRIHPIYGGRKFHKGIDIGGSGVKGKPIVAAADGIVAATRYNSGGYGYYVIIDHGRGDGGKYYASLYAHMTKYIVKPNQYVKKGQTIGYVGTTGASKGYHLHFEIRVGSKNSSEKLLYSTTNPMNYY